MYPFLRMAWIMAASRRKPKVGPDDYCDLRLTAWPWDCDMFGEVNNGRQLTLFDLGRFDFGVRGGLIDLLRQRRWGLTVAGSSMHYRKRITPFQRYTLRTRLAARDDRWFYMTQTTYRGETPCSQGLIRTAVIDRARGVVPTDEIMEALGYADWRPVPPDWIGAWDAADRIRPWPPEAFHAEAPLSKPA